MAGGHTYDLLQFHFHSKSEHEIAGEIYPMEVHFVHQEHNGTALFVVGRFIKIGTRDNPDLAPIFSALPKDPATRLTVAHFNVMKLLPRDLKSYRYSGSLTTPPFTEGVAWNVLAQPIEMSQAQVNTFRALFPEGDSREVQKLNGRVIKTDVRNLLH